MADTYSATVLQEAIYKASQKDTFQSFETRGSNYGALDAAMRQNSMILPPSIIENMKKASGQTTSVDVFKREAPGNGTARKCSGTGAGATANVPITWQTVVEEFEMSFLQMAQNRYSYTEMFQLRFEEKLKAIYKRMDSIVLAALEANYSAGLGTNFGTFNNAFQVPASSYDLATNRVATWLNKLKADIRKNDFDPDQIHMVGESNMEAVLRSMLAQGNSTATNLAFQFGNFGADFTNRLENNTGIYATGYVFQKGAFGLLSWINPLHRAGKTIGTDEWTRFQDTRYGMDIELKIKRGCEDNSADITGAQADYTESFVLSVDVAVPVAYSSDSNTGIYKYELNEDDSVLSGSGSYV